MVVTMPGLYLNAKRAAGTGIWILDDQDREMISAPLARIAARRMPELEGDTGDVVDGLLTMVGVGGYVIKNVTAERQARAQRGGATLEAPGGQPEEAA